MFNITSKPSVQTLYFVVGIEDLTGQVRVNDYYVVGMYLFIFLLGLNLCRH